MATAAISPPPIAGLKLKLALMMFFQFFIWGAWYELGFDYIPRLGFNDVLQLPDWLGGAQVKWQVPLIFGAFNIGALVALFFSTQFADRKFAAEKFLAFSHLVGGLAILGLFFVHSFWPFFLLMLVHSIFYVPTISITNSIAFANLRDPTREFGPCRLWGTIGWIAASWPFIFILVDWQKVPALSQVGFTDWVDKALSTSITGETAMDLKRYIFLVAGVASLVLAGFSLMLPHTPPKPATSADESLAWLKAMKLLKHPFVAVLFLVTFIDAAVHQSFFFWTFTFLGPKADGGVVNIPSNWVGPVMKIGQIAEVVTMLFLGYVLKNLGWRMTMTLGVLGHAGRFAVFAFFPQPIPAILVNALHGICYAFFFATVYLFVDEFFPKDIRSSAQGLFNVLILGAGPFVANFLCEQLKTHYADQASAQAFYSIVYQYSMGAALAGAIILVLFFHPPAKQAPAPSFSKVEEDAPPWP